MVPHVRLSLTRGAPKESVGETWPITVCQSCLALSAFLLLVSYSLSHVIISQTAFHKARVQAPRTCQGFTGWVLLSINALAATISALSYPFPVIPRIIPASLEVANALRPRTFSFGGKERSLLSYEVASFFELLLEEINIILSVVLSYISSSGCKKISGSRKFNHTIFKP